MVRKNLIKLVRHCNMLNPMPTENSPEYRFLDPLLSDEIVDCALKMKLRKPYSLDEFTALIKKPRSEAERIFNEMEQIGISEMLYEGDKRRAKLTVFAPGMFELMAMKREDMEKYPHMGECFDDYITGLGKKFFSLFPDGSGLMTVIPVQKAIEDEPRRVNIEEIDFWINKYVGHIAVGNCQCRTLRRQAGVATADLEGEWCISLGDFAEQVIKTGKARRISTEEAYDIIKRAEELGYVHELSNIDGPESSVFICNCNADTCLALRTSTLLGAQNFSRTNFVATVNTEDCVACGCCVEMCPENAVRLGRKLCSKKPINIPETLTSSDHHLGKNGWQLDFLTTRQNVIPETGTAPCKTACPAHIAVQGYVKLVGEGRYREALELIKRENPFPAICGRICPHKCEDACTRGLLDAPVAIDEIKRFVAEQDMRAETRFAPKKKFNEGKKIAVIGAVPAGLSCAYFLAMYGHQVTVFEKQEQLGGMLKMGIPSFRLEKDVIDAEIDILRLLGVEFKTGVEVGKDLTLDTLRAEGYKGFYLAIGAQNGRQLGVEGEEAPEVISGVELLRGATLGKPAQLNGNVIVIGGGNVAIDVARTATRVGGKNVTMYCLESREEMPALDEEIDEANGEGVAIENRFGPKRILVENGKVTGVEFKKVVSVFDENHCFSPKYNENETIIVPVDYVILSIGQSIDWGGLLDGSKVELGGGGRANADGFTYQTAARDVFVGGDCYSGPKFAIDAIAAGKQGAESLHRFVWAGHDLILGRDRREYQELDKNNLDVRSYDNTSRQKPGHIAEYEGSFKDTRATMTETQVKAESGRCLGCGAASVNPNKCIGCGVCTTHCKLNAITLSKVRNDFGVTYEKLPLVIGKYTVKREGKIVARKVKDLAGKKD